MGDNSTLIGGDPLSRSRVEVIMEVFTASVVNTISIIANFVVILAIHKDRNLKTTTNAFIANLGVVDLVVSILLMPLWIVSLYRGRWIFGPVLCDLAAYFYYVLSNASLNTLSLIAVVRYLKVVKTQLYTKVFSEEKNARILAVLTWVVPLAFCSPPLYGWGEFSFYPSSAMCVLKRDFSNVGYLSFIIVCQPSPLIICACYYAIFRAVRKNRLQICSRKNRAACQNAQDAEAHLIHTAFAIGCVILVCWSPSAIAFFLFASGVSGVEWLLMLSTYLVFITSTLNPVIYGFFNPQFKRAFQNMFTCKSRVHAIDCAQRCCPSEQGLDRCQAVTELASSL